MSVQNMECTEQTEKIYEVLGCFSLRCSTSDQGGYFNMKEREDEKRDVGE